MILDKNILVINNSLFDKTLNYKKSFYSYNLNYGEIKNKNSINLNCSKKLHNNAHKYKNDYIDQVSSMKKYFSNYNFKFKYSIFHLTDLSCKRTEFLNSFLFLCHLSSIREIIHSKKINLIELIDCPKEFLNSLKSFFNGNIRLNNSILILVKNKYLNYYKLVSQIHFFIKMIIIYFFLYFFYKKKKIIFKNKIFFSSYPKNFDFNAHIKYGKLVDKNDTYLLSLITDGIHQNLSIYNYFNYFFKIKKRQ